MINPSLTVLPELGVISPVLKPGKSSPDGYPALHCTLMSPNSPVRVTIASHVPVSKLETCRAREAKPTCTTSIEKRQGMGVNLVANINTQVQYLVTHRESYLL